MRCREHGMMPGLCPVRGCPNHDERAEKGSPRGKPLRRCATEGCENTTTREVCHVCADRNRRARLLASDFGVDVRFARRVLAENDWSSKAAQAELRRAGGMR